MRKLILTVVYCFITLVTVAQQQKSKEVSDFESYTNKVENQRQESSQKKDYATTVELISDWINKYEHSSADIKTNFKGNNQVMYYNLACYQNLQGKKEIALASFEKAVELGYSNYNNTLVDTDLLSLHNEKRFKKALQILQERGDMKYVLKKSAPYKHEKIKDIPTFSYQSSKDPELVKFKNEFNLDSIAGNGDEISKFKKLLYWAHNTVRHDGSSTNPPSKNARDIIEVCKKENRGVNCRMMATILKDAYQAEGFNARVVTCLPKDTTDNDCHVITVVWSNTYNKWIWMDPTFNAYVSDKKGNLLSIEEVRERLKKDGDLVLNEDANWNNKNKQTKEYYLDYYMAKNLYWIQCSVSNAWNLETRKQGTPAVEYLNLYPGSFNTIHQSKKVTKGIIEYAISNPEYFWKKP